MKDNVRKEQKGLYATCSQKRFRSACSFAQSDKGFHFLLTESVATARYIDGQRIYLSMIRQICNIWPQDVTTRSNELLAWLGIEDLNLILKERRLRWYGYVEHSNGAVKTAFHIQVEGKYGPGRPKMTWKQLTERDCESGSSWLSTLMVEICGDLCEICHACSKPAIWKRAHWCGCCPCTCTLIKNLIMMMIENVQTITDTYNFQF